MAIDPRISLGVQQLQLPDPLAQYGQVQNILAAGTQNELAQTKLAESRLALRQAQEAQDFITKTMNAAKEHGAPTDDPMEAAMQMLRHPNPTVQAVGGHLLDANQKVMAYQQQKKFLEDQTPNALAAQPETAAPAPAYKEVPAFGAPAREPSTVPPNKLAPAASAAHVNALSPTQERTAQSLAAEINKKDVLYGTAPGWLKQRELLVDEYKQLIKPEFEFKEITNPDGTVSVQAINKRTARSQPVLTQGDQQVSGISIPAQRLAWEKANPGKTIKEVTNADGTTSLYGINNRTGEATPITLGDSNLTGVDTSAQSLAFQKQKFAWEQANPGKTVKEVTNADGTTSFFGINNRTGEATPITLSADLTVPGQAGGQPLVGAKVHAPPSMVAEYQFAKTPEGGSFKGTYQQFVTARAEAGRAPAAPQPPVAVVGPDGKQIYVTREEALRNKMTPANAMEGLSPKEIQKREAAYPQATTAVKAIETKINTLIKDLQTLRDHPGLDSITGIAAGRLPAITANGRAAQALYDKIVAEGGFQVLQDIRDASKTGGALGNISDKEGAQLKSAFAAIDRKQDAPDVRKALDEAISNAQGSKARIREAYDMTYEYKNQSGGAAPAPAKAPAGVVDTNNPLLKGK